MLDFDLARVYGVETKSLNRAVKLNADRFSKDFVFQISEDEWKNLSTNWHFKFGRRTSIFKVPNWYLKF